MRRPTRLVLATANPGKRRELEAILAGLALDPPIACASLEALGPVRLPPEGLDYEANARAKARAVAAQRGEWALADDSGLEVDALDGAPGPLSARFGGPGLDDAGRVRALLRAVAESGRAERGARFVCVAALASPEGEIWSARGALPGALLDAPRGGGGFGYDPVFRPDGDARSLAEIPAAEKDRLSHRARAVRALAGRVCEAIGA